MQFISISNAEYTKGQDTYTTIWDKTTNGEIIFITYTPEKNIWHQGYADGNGNFYIKGYEV